MISALENMSNPFAEDSSQLFALDTSVIMTQAVVDNVINLEAHGQKQYDTFFKDRVSSQSIPWSDTIHLNRYELFSSKSKSSKKNSDKARLKQDKTHFIQLLLSSQSGRDIDKKEVFIYENCDYPLTLCRNEKMYSGSKSELLRCLEEDINITDMIPSTDVAVIDGSLMVHLLKPEACKTFKEYADDIILPYLCTWLNTVV